MENNNLILLVEDDPAYAEAVRRNLSNACVSSRLLHLSDGQSALNYLFRQNEFSTPEYSARPRLVLLDLHLPKIDGVEVLKAIKADDSLARIPVVMLTTSSEEADIAKAYAFHANSYLVKPIDFVKFGDLIEALCNYWLVWNQSLV